MYYDFWNEPISVGDYVYVSRNSGSRSSSSRLDFCRITKFHDKSKKVSLEPVDKQGQRRLESRWDGTMIPATILVMNYKNDKFVKYTPSPTQPKVGNLEL